MSVKTRARMKRGRALRRVLGVAVLALGLSLSAASGVDAEAPVAVADVDCSDGYPRLGCKIWKVTVGVEIGLPTSGSVTCETTDEWICAKNLF